MYEYMEDNLYVKLLYMLEQWGRLYVHIYFLMIVVKNLIIYVLMREIGSKIYNFLFSLYLHFFLLLGK
jgi:hypothetical protein